MFERILLIVVTSIFFVLTMMVWMYNECARCCNNVYSPIRQWWDTYSVKQRMREFYWRFNYKEFRACMNLVDPALVKGDFGRHYINSLERFHERYAPLRIKTMNVNVYKHENNFMAYAEVTYLDGHKHEHKVQERWIMRNHDWYTRCCGYVTEKKATG